MDRKLKKATTGIEGLDEITGGGLPAGRATLVFGGPGTGKTLLGAAFLVQGALYANEPGVLISFDEPLSELEINCRSVGLDLAALQEQGLLAMEHVHLDPSMFVETGDYDLEGLFIRIGHAVDRVQAKRIVLDSIDTLFSGIPNEAILRAELRRLFEWLKGRELSAVITGERGEGRLSRHGIEEYVSDCVILLDTRVQDELATRRLRIVKYRGSAHGSNEFPYLIEDAGIVVLPVTSLGLAHEVSADRISTGVAGFDAMLGGQGFYRGSSVLISGGPGTGKTSFAAQFAVAAGQRGERCVYFSFEESDAQLIRNMKTIGMDFQPLIDRKLLLIKAVRPTFQGLELHLASMLHLVQSEKPNVVVIDPLSALQASGSSSQSILMMLRLVDYLKSLGTTAMYLSVNASDETTDLHISSLMDTWVATKNLRRPDDLERNLFIVKSRGMPHSPDVRKFVISENGLEISCRKNVT